MNLDNLLSGNGSQEDVSRIKMLIGETVGALEVIAAEGPPPVRPDFRRLVREWLDLYPALEH